MQQGRRAEDETAWSGRSTVGDTLQVVMYTLAATLDVWRVSVVVVLVGVVLLIAHYVFDAYK